MKTQLNLAIRNAAAELASDSAHIPLIEEILIKHLTAVMCNIEINAKVLELSKHLRNIEYQVCRVEDVHYANESNCQCPACCVDRASAYERPINTKT